MSTESLAIAGLTVLALALPAMGAWFYQVFALKRDLADTERRLIEAEGRQEQHLRDTERRLIEAEGRQEQHLRDMEGRLHQAELRALERLNGVEQHVKAVQRTLQDVMLMVGRTNGACHE